MRDAPDRSVAIFGHEKRAILCNGNADRAAPDLSVGDHKTSHESARTALDWRKRQGGVMEPESAPRQTVGSRVSGMAAGRSISGSAGMSASCRNVH